MSHLKMRGIDVTRIAEYKKYLRFYLDFAGRVKGAATLPEVQGSDHCPMRLDFA